MEDMHLDLKAATNKETQDLHQIQGLSGIAKSIKVHRHFMM
jgi:hypothetical protein